MAREYFKLEVPPPVIRLDFGGRITTISIPEAWEMKDQLENILALLAKGGANAPKT